MNIDKIYECYAKKGLGGDTGAILTLAQIIQGKPHHGKVTLATGNHVLTYQTEKTPSKVYIFIDSDGVPVCQGNLPMAGVVLGVGEFTIYADVPTNSCTLHYFVE